MMQFNDDDDFNGFRGITCEGHTQTHTHRYTDTHLGSSILNFFKVCLQDSCADDFWCFRDEITVQKCLCPSNGRKHGNETDHPNNKPYSTQ